MKYLKVLCLSLWVTVAGAQTPTVPVQGDTMAVIYVVYFGDSLARTSVRTRIPLELVMHFVADFFKQSLCLPEAPVRDADKPKIYRL